MALQQGRGSERPEAVHADAIGAPPRAVTTYRVGKIATAAGQALCIVRMIEPHKVAIDIEMPFEDAAEASLTIGAETVRGALAMTGGKRAELSAPEPIDAEAILADPAMTAAAGRRAFPRVEVDAKARIEVTGRTMAARVCDISTDGMKVLVDDLLCVGDRVAIAMRGLESRLAGLVRWCDGDHAGIEFAQPLPLGRLNVWLAATAAA